MKINVFPYILILLAATLFVSSCGPDPRIESARQALGQANYEEVIRLANEAIENDPENADAYYYKAVAHASIANDKPHDQRRDDYAMARDLFQQARLLYEQQEVSSHESQSISDIIIELWGIEYNAGLLPLSDDIFRTPEDSLKKSLDHFNNAATINPDSVHSFNLLAEVHFAAGNMAEAEYYTRHVIFEMGHDDLFNYYRLAYYLMETDRDSEAIDILYQALEIYPGEIEVIQELANAYLRLGETDRALEVVQELIDLDPDNPQYRLVYATQVYQVVQDLDLIIRDLHDEVYDLTRDIRQIARQPNPDRDEIQRLNELIDQKLTEADELIEESLVYSRESEEHLLIALRSDPNDPDIQSTLGVVYQNRAAVLQDQRNMTEDADEADEFDRQAREYLEKALPFYERAAELEQNNPEHWQALFRIYTNLGMDEKAAEAQERAGY